MQQNLRRNFRLAIPAEICEKEGTLRQWPMSLTRTIGQARTGWPTRWRRLAWRVRIAAVSGLLLVLWQEPTAGQTPARIIVQPHDELACVGSDVTFYVEADGTAPINFQWTSNGVPVFSGVVFSPTNSTLTISNVQLFNNGDSFNVTAFNGFGPPDYSTNASLFVGDLPHLIQQPTSQFVPIGAPISFNVLAQPPPLKYRWWFEGQPLTNSVRVLGADSPNLRILNAQLSDAGYYRCVISNSCRAMNSLSVSCDVGAPLLITNQPVSQVAPFRANVQFTVGATGSPFLFYKWFRNDVPIPGANNPVLVRPAVERPDVGIYHAVVFNNFGAAASDRAHLQIELTLDGDVRVGEEATDDTPSLTNALARFVSPTFVSHGVPLLFSTYDATAEPWESSRCGVPPTHSMWLRYYSPRAELTKITTEGSDFDTVAGVYTWDGSTNTVPVQLACDNNSGYDGRDSRLDFSAAADANYYIAVDGVAGETGTARVQVGEIMRHPRREPATGWFSVEMAGPYWFTTSLRSSTDLLLPPQFWPSVLTMLATNRDWVVRYTNTATLSEPMRFYRTAVNTNSSPSNP